MKIPQKLYDRIEYALIQMSLAKKAVDPAMAAFILRGAEDIDELIDDFKAVYGKE